MFRLELFFNCYESACTASVVTDIFSVMLTGQTNSRSVFSRTGQLAEMFDEKFRIQKKSQCNFGRRHYL